MFLLERDQPATLVHSASDLVVAAECELRLLRRMDELLGRVPRQGPTEDEMLARTAELGAAHEARVLDDLVARYGRSDGLGPGVYEVPPAGRTTAERLGEAHDATLVAIEAGVDVVYQASFFDGSFYGRADFLVREDLPGRETRGVRTPRYAVHDTKLARRAKVTALLQLAAYADQLRAAHVDPTEHVHLVLGTGVPSSHRLADLLPLLRQRRERMLAILSEHVTDDAPAAWGDERYRACGRCEVCAAEAEAHRDVLTVGGVYVTQQARLASAGIRTIDELAVAQEAPEGMSAGAFDGLRLQARLQLGVEQGHGSVPVEGGELRWLLTSPQAVDRLPPADEGDVFFDFEGDPLWEDPGRAYGLDYLFGLVVRSGSEWTEAPGARTVWRAPAGSPPFVGFWADDLEQEKQALVDFVDYLRRRRERYPGLHVYHYAPYEKTHLLSLAARHGVCEEAVDDLLREGVLVDLFAVVRQSVRISGRSRSIKKLEPLYMGQKRTGEVTDGGASVVAFATYTAHREAGEVAAAEDLRTAITEYNRYDCDSTLELLGWLRRARAQVYGSPPAHPQAVTLDDRIDRQAGTDVEGDATPVRPPNEARVRREALETAVRERVSVRDAERRAEGVDERDADTRALAVLGAAVNYYRREEKPFWQAHFARLEQPVDEWPSRRSWFHVERSEVVTPWASQEGRQSRGRVVALEGRLAEGAELGVGATVNVLYEPPLPAALGEPGPGAFRVCHSRAEILAVAPHPHDPALSVLTVAERLPRRLPDGLAVEDACYDNPPMALAVAAGPRHDAQEQSVEDTAREALDVWDRTGGLPRNAVTDLLRRVPPTLVAGGALPRPEHPGAGGAVDPLAEAVYQAALRLDRTTLAVQGPPGTGKTHVSSHVIARLVSEHGMRVGVVAQSHSAVENLLRAVVGKAGLPAERVAKKKRTGTAAEVGTPVPWTELGNAELAAFAEAHRADGCVVGGTAWDFADARRWPTEGLDLLVVDEAGQFALADAVAVGRAARNLLLLGDPQQLPQVSQGLHPEGVEGSALGWVAGGHDVLPAHLGYFLDVSWRMHPDLCAAVSRLSYEDRLAAHPRAARRTLDGVPSGVRTVRVPHAGNVVASPEEAAEVVRQVQAVVGRGWRDDDAPSRPLEAQDVIVVAPYNAQVTTVRRALADAGLGSTEVGTVDLFQGREAPVVVVTLAASSPHDVTRGMGFLLDRHRINVAVSRGQWCAVVVHSPDLTEFWPHTVEGAEDLGAFLALTGRA
ncbi:TM0106 family RecB-like putative nuclease [Antribacter gilvus]|uniref:TM0106 family RecB-like putative nuclease n=1 Tax=Antribacter gilvus TaxID=2304675 RepID=UPI000F7A5DC6|nr:bifunctional RecB family nuclease/DEAD/DEAH box helicase [Antribacter gilvus]